jgi:hypothetical protein
LNFSGPKYASVKVSIKFSKNDLLLLYFSIS